MNVVGWLAGSLFGSKATQPATSREEEEEEEEERNVNDDTINYDDDDDAAAGDDGMGDGEESDAVMVDSVPHQPPPHAASSSSTFHAAAAHRTPAPAGNTANPFYSIGAVSPAPFHTPAHGASALGASSVAPSSVSHGRLSFGSAFSPAPFTNQKNIPSTPGFGADTQQQQQQQHYGTPDIDAQLRAAFAAFESGSIASAASLLDPLMAARASIDFDTLVLSLAKRTTDSRHLHDSLEVNVALVGELRTKAKRWEALLQFIRTPIIQAAGDRHMHTIALWSLLSHTGQSSFIQSGELLECALALKLFLNIGPEAHTLGGSVGGVTLESSDLFLLARRSIAQSALESMVSDRPEGAGLIRAGLAPQDVFFSETSRLHEIVKALQVQCARQEERNQAAAAPSTSVVSHERLCAVSGAVEILHSILMASKAFESQPAIASALDSRSRLVVGEQAPIGWLLLADVRLGVKSILHIAVESIRSIHSTTKVTIGGKAMTTFEAAAWQANIFEHSMRITRVYLQAFTKVLASIDRTRQSGNEAIQSMVETEEQLHAEFVRDRSELLRALLSASRHMSEFNYTASSVFVVPHSGLPGVPAPIFPPLQALYEVGQEFQDYRFLYDLTTFEESHIGERRLIFFVAHYGWEFMRVLVEEHIKSNKSSELLELATLATSELPTYVRTSHTRGVGFFVRDSSGDTLELDREGCYNGIPIFDLWLQQLLKTMTQLAWLHELQMEQWKDAGHMLKGEAQSEKRSIGHKKTLLSLSKLALLASATDGGLQTPNAPTGLMMMRANSDASHGSTSSDDAFNPNELNAINDELSVVAAQEFLDANRSADDEDREDAAASSSPSPSSTTTVLDPDSLIRALLSTGCDRTHTSLIRLHSFCFAFDVLEKVFLPKPRSTPFDRFSEANQTYLLDTWSACISADSDLWTQIVALKSRDPTDAWQQRLTETQLGQVWNQIMKSEIRCYDREDVYVESFLHLLHQPSSRLPNHLQSNEVRIVLESTLQLVKAQHNNA